MLNLVVFGLIAWGTVVLEKRRHGALEAPAGSQHEGLRRFLRGPWPLVWGAIGLALLNYATLALAGRPWGITSAFALWGAKTLSGLGVDVGSWAFWQMPGNAKALAAPLWEDVTTVMDIGIVLGALLAAGLAGRFAPSLKDSAALAAGRGDRRPAAGLRLAAGVWLQHRRVLQRYRLGQRAWLAVAGGGVCRQRGGGADSPAVLRG